MIWESFIDSCKEHGVERESLVKYRTIKNRLCRSIGEKSSQEVEAYETYLQVIVSFHKSISGLNWKQLGHLESPVEPEKKNYFEKKIRREVSNFQPSLYERLFKKDKKKLNQLMERIPYEIEKDNQKYYQAVDKYTDYLEEYKEIKTCYDGIRGADENTYLYWLNKSKAFDELYMHGIDLSFDYNEATLNVVVDYSQSKLIPMYSKKLIDDQVIAVVLTESVRHDLLKDVIYSCTVRVAREIFELLPINKTIIKNYSKHDDPVLAVVFKRELFERLDIDASSTKYIVESFNYKTNMDLL